MSRFSGCNELRVWGLKNWDGSTASNSYQLRSSVFLFRLRGMPQRVARALPPTRDGGKPDNLVHTRYATPVQRAGVPSERAAGCTALLSLGLLRRRTGGARPALR